MSQDKSQDNNQDKKYNVFQNLIYCIRETKKGCPKLLVFAALIIVLGCGIPLLTAFLPKVVIEQITGKSELSKLLGITAVMTFSLAILMAGQKFLDRMAYWNKFHMNAYFLRQVTKKGLTTDYRNQEKEHFRKLQNESYATCNGNSSYYAQVYDAMISFFSNLLGFLTFLGILVMLNPLLLLFLVGTTLISFFLNRLVMKWVEGHTEEKVGYEQQMQYVISASNDIRAAKDIRLYHMSTWLGQVYEKNQKGLIGWYRRYTAKLFGVSAVDSGLSLIREGVTYLVLIMMVFDGKLSVAEFFLYFQVVAGFSTWLGSLLGQMNHLEFLNLNINRLRSYLEYPETYLREGGIEITPSPLPSKIELRNVSFRYDEDGEDILKGINLVIEPGEHLAVVGLNGAGKTTLIKLISGLIDPTDGCVLYDDIDVRKYNRSEFYGLFGAVFQDHSILPVSIKEIVAERVDGKIDEAKVEHCLKQAGLWEKISSLKDGMDAKFDKSFWEDGINLSGGETQKLLLARALYRNSPVILLDEPTAALDPISENRLYETYDEVMEKKSTVFISHRLASTRFCSRILLLEDGRVLEEGTHEELLLKKGRYYQLFETQAKYYREHPEGEEGEHEV